MRAQLVDERGFTLVELIVVMVILGIVLTGLVNVLVSGSRAQSDTSARATAQGSARMALDRLEYEARCATSATILNSGAGVYLSLPSQCSHASGNVSWCVSLGSLKRYAATSCTGTATTFISSVTSATPFSMPGGSNSSKLAVSLAVNSGNNTDGFSVADTITFRNTTAAISAPSPASGSPGTSVTITGTYFWPSAALTVTVGGIAATITSGGTTDSNGNVNVTFQVPFNQNGSYPIVVSDGTHSLTSATNFTVTGVYTTLTFQAISTPATTTSPSGVMTVNYPAGTAVNDLLVLVVAQNVDSTPTDPSGWTRIADKQSHMSSTVGLHVRMYYKLAAGESSVAVTADSATGAQGAVAWVVRFNRPAGYPPNPTVAYAYSAGGGTKSADAGETTLTPTSPQTNAADATVVSLVVNRTSGPLTLTTPQGFTSEASSTVTPGTASDTLALADQIVATSGTTPTAPTWSVGTSSNWVGLTFAFTS